MENDTDSMQRSAQQFAAKGEYANAIAEWKKILAIRRDANTYNTIGDLYLKKRDKETALKYYSAAAKIFRKNGFRQKAIAIYNKALSVTPFDVTILKETADIYNEQGLVTNAVKFYHKAAEILNRNRDFESAMETYEKILQLSSGDMESKTKIAEIWHKRGFKEKAAHAFSEIASAYLEENEPDKARQFFLKANEINPSYVASLTDPDRLNTTCKEQEGGAISNAITG